MANHKSLRASIEFCKIIYAYVSIQLLLIRRLGTTSFNEIIFFYSR